MVEECGIDICHETVRPWWNCFGPMFGSEIRWDLDEVFVRINGERDYLWRAVDHEGEVLESFVTKRREKGVRRR